MRLTYRQIEVFHEVMVNQGITAAAKAMGSSQPTVSREISGLEARIGVKLFVRRGRQFVPTPQAYMLFKAVHRSFVSLAEIGAVARSISHNRTSLFRIGCMPAYADIVVPHLVEALQVSSPHAFVKVVCQEENLLALDFQKHVFDVVIGERRQEGPSIICSRINTGDMKLLVGFNHRFADRTSVSLAELAGESVVQLETDDPYQREVDKMMQSQSVEVGAKVEITTSSGVCALVRQGIGIAILNPLTAANVQNQGIRVLDLEIAIPHSFYYSFYAEQNSAQLVQAVMRVVRKRVEASSTSQEVKHIGYE